MAPPAASPVAQVPRVVRPFSQQLGTDFVKIYVGNGAASKAFSVHKQLLCDVAPAFGMMFNTKVEEGKTRSAILPKDDPLSFEVFVGWLYRDIIDTVHPGAANISLLINLIKFAEKYDIKRLTDNAIDAFRSILVVNRWVLTKEDFASCYENTSSHSKLRLFGSRMLAYYITNFVSEGVLSTINLLPTVRHRDSVMLDVLEAFRPVERYKPVAVADPRTRFDCDYHQHGEDEACPYSKKRKRIEG